MKCSMYMFRGEVMGLGFPDGVMPVMSLGWGVSGDPVMRWGVTSGGGDGL